MNKFLYAILLNLLIFRKKYHCDALVTKSETLSKIPFEIEDSLLNEIKYLPKLQKRSPEYTKVSETFKPKDTEKKTIKRYFDYFKNPYNPYPAQNIQPFLPQDEGGEINFENAEHLNDAIEVWNDNKYTNCMKDIERKWKNFLKRKRRKRVLKYLTNFEPETSLKYLDYTNSQMPFNEGKAQYKRFKKKNPQVFDGSLIKGKKGFANSYDHYFDSELEPYIGRSLRKYFELPLRTQKENFKTFGDDSILKYSRVRRFLDHERAKKRKRMSSTLEAKEAAMSRVLDPNVNLEGILEPHVRKRRGQNTKKMRPESQSKIREKAEIEKAETKTQCN